MGNNPIKLVDLDGGKADDYFEKKLEST